MASTKVGQGLAVPCAGVSALYPGLPQCRRLRIRRIQSQVTVIVVSLPATVHAVCVFAAYCR